MAEDYRFREIRKNERDDVLTFAAACGLETASVRLQHHLSLVVRDGEGAMVAAALCLDDEDGRHTIEIVTSEDVLDQDLATELADRCLRKVQGEAIGSARLLSPKREPADTILLNANWLDQIQETAPPNAEDPPANPAVDPSQAA